MRFLVDMGLAPSTAGWLRSLGYDAVHLREQELQRLEDHGIVTKAAHEQRIILTHDLDFGRIVALSRERFPTVITFRLDDMRAQQVERHLQDILDRFAGELVTGALISVTDQAVRIRRLPIR